MGTKVADMKLIIIIVCAVVLDLIFGDPDGVPHPICLIGNMIAHMEKKIRKVLRNEFLGGMLLALSVGMLSFLLPFVILYLAHRINYYVALLLEIYFCYKILAIKSLKTESMKVYHSLVYGNLNEARKYLSYIVGRDTEALSAKEITKATVETVAENTTDAVVAPLIFMAFGGAPLAFLYKAINTMDSMIGYKNEKYYYFGKFAARLDDVANFIPSRIAAIAMILASSLLKLDLKNAVKIYIRDRKKHKSPNSAQTESVCAGALNIQLAGDACYFGQLVHKPIIGDNNREIVPEDIVLANKLMYVTSLLAVIIILTVKGVICWMR